MEPDGPGGRAPKGRAPGGFGGFGVFVGRFFELGTRWTLDSGHVH